MKAIEFNGFDITDFLKNFVVLILWFLFLVVGILLYNIVGFWSHIVTKTNTIFVEKLFEPIKVFNESSFFNGFDISGFCLFYVLCSHKELRGLIRRCLSVEWMKLLNAVDLQQIALNFMINSRTAIAGAIIGLLLVFFYFVVMIFVTTIWRHSHFLFIRSCKFNWIACVTSFFALSGASFLFMRVIKFLVTLDLPHSQKWLPHFEIDFYLL